MALDLPSAASDSPLTIVFVVAPALSVYPIVTANEQPLPDIAAVVVWAMAVTRYIPAAGDAIRFVEAMDAVCAVSDRLPGIVDVEVQLPIPLIMCKLSQVPTPE